MSDPRLARKAAELRVAFDSAFSASEQQQVVDAQVDVLAIRVAEQGYALRLAQVQAVHAERKLVPVPAPAPELLGLVGLRGLVVPVYDLRLLLGHPAGPAPRWLVLVRGTPAVCVAFEALEAHVRVPASDVVLPPRADVDAKSFGLGSVLIQGEPRPLLHLPALLDRIQRGQPAHPAPQREGPR